jgi:anti-sigma B factor antagonist
VQYISSAGLRTLLMAYRHAERVGTALAVTGLSAHLRSILSATGFLRFFAVADTTADGLAVLQRAGD